MTEPLGPPHDAELARLNATLRRIEAKKAQLAQRPVAVRTEGTLPSPEAIGFEGSMGSASAGRPLFQPRPTSSLDRIGKAAEDAFGGAVEHGLDVNRQPETTRGGTRFNVLGGEFEVPPIGPTVGKALNLVDAAFTPISAPLAAIEAGLGQAEEELEPGFNPGSPGVEFLKGVGGGAVDLAQLPFDAFNAFVGRVGEGTNVISRALTGDDSPQVQRAAELAAALAAGKAGHAGAVKFLKPRAGVTPPPRTGLLPEPVEAPKRHAPRADARRAMEARQAEIAEQRRTQPELFAEPEVVNPLDRLVEGRFPDTVEPTATKPPKQVFTPSEVSSAIAANEARVQGRDLGEPVQPEGVKPPNIPTKESEIIQSMRDLIDQPIRVGRLGGAEAAPPNVIGQFAPNAQAIRIRYANDVTTAAHEVAHSLMNSRQMGDPARAPVKLRNELVRLGEDLTGKKGPEFFGENLREGAAELIADFVRPEEGRLPISGELRLWMVNSLNHRALTGLTKIRKQAAQFEAQGPEARADAFINARPTLKQRVKDAPKAFLRGVRKAGKGAGKLADRFQTEFIDDLNPLRQFEADVKSRDSRLAKRRFNDPSGVTATAGQLLRSSGDRAAEYIDSGKLLGSRKRPDRFAVPQEIVDSRRQGEFIDVVEAMMAKRDRASGLPTRMSESVQNGVLNQEFALRPEVQRAARKALVDQTLAGSQPGPGLKDIIEPLGPSRLNDFQRVVAALRSKDLEAQGVAPGLRVADADFILRQPYAQDPVMQRAAKQFSDWNRRLFEETIVKNGGLDAETWAAIQKKNPNFFSFNHIFSEAEGGPGAKAKRPIKGATDIPVPSRRARGGTAEIENILQSAVNDAHHLIAIGDRLKIGRMVAEMADMEGAGRWIERVPEEKVRASASVKDIEASLKDALGEDALNLTPEQKSKFINVYAASRFPKNSGENIVTLMRNGKREWFQLDPELYKVLAEESPGVGTKLGALFGGVTRMKRLGATGANLGFSVITNPIRDIQSYALFNTAKNPVKGATNLWKGLKESVKGHATTSELMELYQAQGAGASTFTAMDRSVLHNKVKRISANTKARKALNIASHPIEALRTLSNVVEGAPRMGEFFNALENAGWTTDRIMSQGAPPEHILRQAANAASDVTVNFKRSGRAVRPWNQVIAFLNPAIQGLDKVARSAGFKKNLSGVRMPGEIKKFHLRAMTAITLPTLALWWQNRDDPDFQAMPGWMRHGYWNIRIKDTGDPRTDWLRIPRVQVVGQVYGALPEAVLNDAYRKDPKVVEKSLGALLSGQMEDAPGTLLNAFSNDGEDIGAALEETFRVAAPPFEPDLVEIGRGIAQNEDPFTGRSIVPRGLVSNEPEEQFTARTSETAKVIGEKLGVAPAILDYAFRQSTGGMGPDLLGVAEEAGGAKDPRVTAKLPFLGRLQSSNFEDRNFDEYWEIRNRLTEKIATERTRRKDPDRRDADEPPLPLLNEEMALLTDMGKQMTQLRSLGFDPSLSDEQRRQVQQDFRQASLRGRAIAQKLLDVMSQVEARGLEKAQTR